MDLELKKSIDSGYFKVMSPNEFKILNEKSKLNNVFIVTVGTPVEKNKSNLIQLKMYLLC